MLIIYTFSNISSKDELGIWDWKSSLVSGCFSDLLPPSLLCLTADIIQTGLENMSGICHLKSSSGQDVGKMHFFQIFFFLNPPTKIRSNFACTPYVIQISLPIFLHAVFGQCSPWMITLKKMRFYLFNIWRKTVELRLALSAQAFLDD